MLSKTKDLRKCPRRGFLTLNGRDVANICLPRFTTTISFLEKRNLPGISKKRVYN